MVWDGRARTRSALADSLWRADFAAGGRGGRGGQSHHRRVMGGGGGIYGRALWDKCPDAVCGCSLFTALHHFRDCVDHDAGGKIKIWMDAFEFAGADQGHAVGFVVHRPGGGFIG